MLTHPLKRTALYQNHVALKGRIVSFAGWEMPVHFGGIQGRTEATGRGVQYGLREFFRHPGILNIRRCHHHHDYTTSIR